MKLLYNILASIVLLTVSASIYARETISILWGFNTGSSTATNARLIAEEANKIQDKYTFVLLGKPGAGGTIAANTVAANPDNTIVAMSSTFIIRPYYETSTTTHNLDQFTPILVQGIGSPLFVFSGKYKNIKQLINKPNLTIGTSGVGSISHLVATEIATVNPSTIIVNFKSMPEASLAAVSGHVDVAIGIYTDVAGLIEDKKLNVLGYTGNSDVLNYKNRLLTNYKMPESDKLVANYAMYASTNMNQAKFIEIHNILLQANQAPVVLENYKKDQLTPVNYNITQSEVWYAVQRRYWKRQVNKIKNKESQ